MNIVFYCQYVLGMGHLFRTLEIVQALVAAGHAVTLVTGGRPVDVHVPEAVELVRLPPLFMDERFTRLISGVPGQSVDHVIERRKGLLTGLFDAPRDLFIIELFPFGRRVFAVELDPVFRFLRSRGGFRTKIVCSLRDILVEKRDTAAFEQRVLDGLERDFDLLLIHSDPRLIHLQETFSRWREIPVPVHYTGFVAKTGVTATALELRSRLGVAADGKLIVASAGGGRTGHRLLAATLAACRRLQQDVPVHLEMFAGPFMADREFGQLTAHATPGLHIHRFSGNFLDYLNAADLSVSMAGYNTCMNLMVTRVPCLVYPYARQQEQPMRVEKIQPLLPMQVLSRDDLTPDTIGARIRDMLKKIRPPDPLPLRFDGAAETARFLEEWGGWDR
jgi:predicted glycosyltransferase